MLRRNQRNPGNSMRCRCTRYRTGTWLEWVHRHFHNLNQQQRASLLLVLRRTDWKSCEFLKQNRHELSQIWCGKRIVRSLDDWVCHWQRCFDIVDSLICTDDEWKVAGIIKRRIQNMLLRNKDRLCEMEIEWCSNILRLCWWVRWEHRSGAIVGILASF